MPPSPPRSPNNNNNKPSSPARNFSYPNRTRPPILHPQQDSRHQAMAQHRRSRMMPTMPSGLFGCSESSPNLRSEQQSIDSIDVAPPRTASSSYSLITGTATALPPFPPTQATPTRSINELSAPTAQSNLRHELLISPRVPSESVKPAVVKTWSKLAEHVKKVFDFGRHRKKSKDKEQAARPTLQIGSPTNFEHRQTGSDRPLMTAEGTIDPKPTTSGDDSGAGRVRFADAVEYVADRPQVESESGHSPGGPLTSHPLVTVFEEAPPATPDDDDDDSEGKQLAIANYDDDSDSSSSSDESRWHRCLASKNAAAQVKDAATQFKDYDAQLEH